MKRNDFLGKRVVLVTVNPVFTRHGVLIDITNSFVVFEDKFDGVVIIPLVNVSYVRLDKNVVNNNFKRVDG